MDAATKYVIELIKETAEKDNCFFDYNKYELQKISYGKWAVEEILYRLKSSEDIPPLIILELFKDEMERYSGFNILSHDIFLVGSQIAEIIIRILI